MDPKRPPYSGPPGVTRIPWMQSAEDQGQPPDQPPLRRARGLILPKDEPLLGRGRALGVPGEMPVRFGRGITQSISELPVGIPRGVRLPIEEGVPIPDIRKLEAQEKMPKLQAQVTPVDAPGLGLSLVSMFRGLSIEPGKTWDRGATPLGMSEKKVKSSIFASLCMYIFKLKSSFSSTMCSYREPLQKMGTKGSPISIGSNYIPICCKNEAVFQYHLLNFSPNVESLGMCFGMMKEHRPTTGEVVAFDGSILYLPKRLEEVCVLVRSERKTDNQEIDIKIQLTKILPPSSDLCIPFYNVVLRRVMKLLGLKLVGRNHYDPNAVVILGKHRLQVWPGYSTSIKHTDGGLYLIVDISHKVLRNDSVLDVMNLFYQGSRESFQDVCTKEFVGSIVITRYNNRIYRIDDIEWSKSPKDTFTLANGTVTTFVDYYRKNYGITIKELDRPLLIHRPNERSKPEGKLFFFMAFWLFRTVRLVFQDLTMHINVGAKQHTQSLKQLLHNINSNNEAVSELACWGLSISQEILVTQGRTLPSENICLHSASFVISPSVDWSREVVRDPSISTVPLNCWAVIYPRRATDQAEELVTTFTRVAGPMGIRIERPIRSIHSQLTIYSMFPLLVFSPMCIMIGNRDDLYSAIKKLCCIQSPVPSQAFNVRTISQPQKLHSIAQQILLQINCKLGGELWTVNVPLRYLMVIGVDVHHDVSKKSRSVMGFVASLNSVTEKKKKKHLGRVSYMGCFEMRASHSKEEVDERKIGDVDIYIKYYYRAVNTGEEIKMLCLHVYGSEHFGTPSPGTVLDHTVTNRDWVDFYLMAHSIRQGCGLPTHYIAVYNTANLTPYHLQSLTYKICHLYWNWPGTIRVPVLRKYAHKLAFLSGQYLHSEPAIQLSEKLFFL
uniref:Piwi-like RNA-mediated gene silencing 2 n=1 Tax=Cyprinus carpio TaxID=7962 RepID=A0A8C1JBH4_CYPCA